jgi:hypothetical protein
LIAGVDKFYIYDNESEDGLKNVLQPYIKSGIVEYKYIGGKDRQIDAYNKTLKKARKETYWLTPIDIDEFIVPISTKTISEFLKDFEDFEGIKLNWLVYGSGGQKTKTDGLVIERFKDHAQSGSVMGKVIINPRRTVTAGVHDAYYMYGALPVDPNKNRTPHHGGEICIDKMRVNHYFGKSWEEFLHKKNRGKSLASKTDRPYDEAQFISHDKNEVKNDPVMDKYIPLIYENLKHRE